MVRTMSANLNNATQPKFTPVYLCRDNVDLLGQQNIIKGYIAGDRNAQAQLYNLYALRVRSRISHNKEEAEEFLQVGFIRVFNYLHKFRGTGSSKGWMRRIMVNAALFKYRSKSSHLSLF